MFKKLQAKLRNKKGFTLVELLIVIAVLGIIAAIAVPRFTGVLSGVKDKADVRAAELFAKEVEAEFMVEKWFGATDTEKTITKLADGTDSSTGFNGEIPKDKNGTDMTVKISKSGSTYTLTVMSGTTHLLKTGSTNGKVINGPIN